MEVVTRQEVKFLEWMALRNAQVMTARSAKTLRPTSLANRFKHPLRSSDPQHHHVQRRRCSQAPGCRAGQAPHRRVPCESIAPPTARQWLSETNTLQLIDNDPYASSALYRRLPMTDSS